MTAEAAPQATCPMCGAALVGTFCHACGQPSRAAPRTLREVLSGQTGRLLHTVRLLLLSALAIAVVTS